MNVGAVTGQNGKKQLLIQTEILSRKTNIIVKVICKYDTTYIWVYTCNALACENNFEMSLFENSEIG